MPVDIGFITGIVISGIIIIGVIGNVMTLFVIIRYKPLRNETGMFLANLAVADLLQSIIGMPLIAASAFHKLWLFGESLCVISGLTNSLFCVTSVLTLTAVSVDRWLSIVYPLQYRNWLTVRRARFTLVYIWIHALFVAILPVFGWSRFVKSVDFYLLDLVCIFLGLQPLTTVLALSNHFFSDQYSRKIKFSP